MRNLIRALIAALSLVALPLVSQAGLFVGVSVNIAPPLLPVYVQPPCPAPGYIWTPGYWAWDDGYYWVPGTWVLAPAVGLLWTPGYWGWSEGVYVWNAGYWGPHVGFYGGVDYGFGYGGVGYQGGYWRGNQFYYNRSVTNINTTNVTNVYNRTVVNNVNVTRVSYNGGTGGVAARPTAAELGAAHERHLGLTPGQEHQRQLASGNSSLRAANNGGIPAIAATPKAGVFSGHGVVAAHGAEHPGSAPRVTRATEERAPQASAQRSDRPPAAQHDLVHESAPSHAPQPQHYASVQSNPRGNALEHESRPQMARPAPQYSAGPAPHYQPPAPAPHYQPAPAAPSPHYQGAPAQAGHYQGAPAQAAHSQGAPAAQGPHYQGGPPAQPPRHQPAPAPQHGGSPDHRDEHNGHG